MADANGALGALLAVLAQVSSTCIHVRLRLVTARAVRIM